MGTDVGVAEVAGIDAPHHVASLRLIRSLAGRSDGFPKFLNWHPEPNCGFWPTVGTRVVLPMTGTGDTLFADVCLRRLVVGKDNFVSMLGVKATQLDRVFSLEEERLSIRHVRSDD